MFAEGINVSESWKEALDDGSLTLAAETFLLSLPADEIPVFTCLYAPELLNFIAASNPDNTPNFGEIYARLKHLHAKQNGRPSLPINQAPVRDEMARLSRWISGQSLHQVSTKQAA